MSNANPTALASLVYEAFLEACDEHGRRRALVDGETVLDYAALNARVQAEGERLRGLVSGTRRPIGFSLQNRLEYPILYFATLAAGHVPFLLDANFNIGEIAAIHEDCGLAGLVIDEVRAADLELGADTAPDRLSEGVVLARPASVTPPFTLRDNTEVCRFTSGTTGRPKCLEFSGRAVVLAARNWVAGTALRSDDRTLCLAALSNGLAFNTSLLASFLAGAELHLFRKLPLTRAVAGWVGAHGITRLVAFPTLYRNFVAPGAPAAEEIASLRHAISAGAPLWADVREEFRRRYALDVSDYYGIAETGPCTFETDPNHHTGLGRPLPEVEIRIDDTKDDGGATEDGGSGEGGEVLVRTASMASGYLNHPGLFEARLDEGGFYHSGDRGEIVNGRLHLLGRTRDHINVAGRKIDPREVLAAVLEMPEVADAVVFPDEDLHRETVVHLAAVARVPGLDRQRIRAALDGRLAPYKVPGKISFVDEIPRTGIGKPRIAWLREQLSAGEVS